jgi:hypothetical protein
MIAEVNAVAHGFAFVITGGDDHVSRRCVWSFAKWVQAKQVSGLVDPIILIALMPH